MGPVRILELDLVGLNDEARSRTPGVEDAAVAAVVVTCGCSRHATVLGGPAVPVARDIGVDLAAYRAVAAGYFTARGVVVTLGRRLDVDEEHAEDRDRRGDDGCGHLDVAPNDELRAEDCRCRISTM